MQSFIPRNLLAELSRLPDWKVKKLSDFDLKMYLASLRAEDADLQARMNWVYGWQRTMESELDKRKAAAEEIRRRQEKDAMQAKALADRNAALERKYLSDQYAE